MIIIEKKDIKKAADMIKEGKIVIIPTETVYGLAANALNKNAVSKIFLAKGRPQDNPLIVHVCDINDVYKLVLDFPYKAELLVEKFWPGPLTIILPRSNIIPKEVSAGLDTVALRMPSHDIARDIIRLSGVPLAAPSANRSGKPSPTCLKHVIDDMQGRADAVVNGGNCKVGVESTVISLVGDKPRLLRPGYITAEQIFDVIGDIDIDNGVCNKLSNGARVISPGMKYKHYSPEADVIMIEGDEDQYIDFVNKNIGDNVYSLCYDEDVPYIKGNYLSYGSKLNFEEQAKNLFFLLRKLDELGAKKVYARTPKKTGVGLAVYNRLIRASGFNIINLEKTDRK